MIVPLAFITLIAFMRSRSAPSPPYAFLLVGMPLLLAGGFIAKSLLSRPASLKLDEEGLELSEGNALVRPQGWRLSWEQIESTAFVHGLYGDELVVVAAGRRETVTIRSPLLGWTLDQPDRLFAELKVHGLSPRRDTEASGEGVQRFPVEGQTGLFAARKTVFWALIILALISTLEILTHRWNRLIPHAIITAFFAYSLASATRTATRLDISDTAITLRQISPRGFLSAFRPHPQLEEKTVWTMDWTSLRRVRLGRKEGKGLDLWLELEADHSKPSLRYRDASGSIERADALRRVFNAHGFPVELVLWPDRAESEGRPMTEAL